LEDQEREVREDGDDAVKKHGAQAFLRGLFYAQWLSLLRLRKETDSFNRGVCQLPRGVRLRKSQVIYCAGIRGKIMLTPEPACQHKRTQLIAKDEDAQFVECLDCGEILEAGELKNEEPGFGESLSDA
jgi:hypothetical protein